MLVLASQMHASSATQSSINLKPASYTPILTENNNTTMHLTTNQHVSDQALVDMSVIRVTNNPLALNIDYHVLVNVDSQIVAKYPSLQSALKTADEHLEEFNSFCQNGHCMGSMPPPVFPVYIAEIPADAAKAIVSERGFNFHHHDSLPPNMEFTLITVNGITYIIRL